MTSTRTLGAALVAATLAMAWFGLDRALDGVPNFYVWKAVSGRAHGGARADIRGISLYYETFGDGPPVLVLHGGGSALESMHYQITRLAVDHRVIAPDSRGHGRSTDGPGPLHYADMADDVIALMDRLHVAKADVVGWSDGGIIALDLAMRYPARIGRIVTLGANFNPDGLIDKPTLPVVIDTSPGGANLVYRLTSPTPDHWPVFIAKVQTLWATEPHYTLADLGAIRSPALIIAGEHDAIRRDHTDALARAIPGAREVIVPGATHRVAREKPDTVNAAIDAFLSRDRLARPSTARPRDALAAGIGAAVQTAVMHDNAV